MNLKTKEKHIKKQPFPIYPISSWGVGKYGVDLFVNSDVGSQCFKDGSSLDVEDDEQGNFVGLGIYDPRCGCYYWNDWELAKKLTIPKFIAHNGVSDLRKLQKWGFKIDESWLLWDTQLMAHILDSTASIGFGLKDLAKTQLVIEYPSYDDIVGKRTKKQTKPRITLDKQPLDLVSEYNAMDTYTTYKLYEKQIKTAYPSYRDAKEDINFNYFTKLEQPCSLLFNKMSEKGIKADLPYLKQLKDTLEAQKKPLSTALANELGNINIGSPKQLLGALNAKGIHPELKGKPSTDKRALEGLKHHPIVNNLLAYSELDTLLSSFVSPYLERNQEVVHPRFNQCGTRTGRPSCSDPNLLQIPKRTENGKLVRRMFVARDGCLFGDVDYSEGEPRMLAHLSKDPAMLNLFIKDEGFHSYFAKHLNITRERAKVFDLETYYRATKWGVARHLNCGLQEAQKRIDEAWNLFPSLYDWEQKIIYQAKKDGYITTLMGRRIKIENLDNNNEWRRTAAERQAMNNLAQASLQECMKAAMIEVDKAGVTILVQVYDELLFESPEECISSDMELVIDRMTTTTKLDVPLKVESKIGLNWAEVR